MFCINCGRKMNPSAARCPKCGGEPAPADYCGGFWKLTEIGAPAPKAAPIPSAAPAPAAPAMPAPSAEPVTSAADEALIRQQQEMLADAQHQIMAAKSRERTLRMSAVMLGAALLVMVVALIVSLATRGSASRADDDPQPVTVITAAPEAAPTPEPAATTPVETDEGKPSEVIDNEKTPEPSVTPTEDAENGGSLRDAHGRPSDDPPRSASGGPIEAA